MPAFDSRTFHRGVLKLNLNPFTDNFFLLLIMDNPKPPGAGSLWNPNSWHWEEKDYTNIAKQLIEKKIAELKLTKDGITIANSCKNIKGEA